MESQCPRQTPEFERLFHRTLTDVARDEHIGIRLPRTGKIAVMCVGGDGLVGFGTYEKYVDANPARSGELVLWAPRWSSQDTCVLVVEGKKLYIELLLSGDSPCGLKPSLFRLWSQDYFSRVRVEKALSTGQEVAVLRPNGDLERYGPSGEYTTVTRI